jgi:hypothetical protein
MLLYALCFVSTFFPVGDAALRRRLRVQMREAVAIELLDKTMRWIASLAPTLITHPAWPQLCATRDTFRQRVVTTLTALCEAWRIRHGRAS